MTLKTSRPSRLVSGNRSIWLDAVEIGGLDRRLRGCYVLLLFLRNDCHLYIGRLGRVFMPAGYYAYTGSAARGIRGRVARYFRSGRKRHWHIDYLLEAAEVIGVAVRKGVEPGECDLARRLTVKFMSIAGFGSSDCRCGSHLFYSKKKRKLADYVVSAMGPPDMPGERIRRANG